MGRIYHMAFALNLESTTATDEMELIATAKRSNHWKSILPPIQL